MAYPNASAGPNATLAQASGQAPAATQGAPQARIVREVAHRAFAQEFNSSRHEIKGQGEKDPSFLVTPLGAKVNRIHVVGVCTDIESVGESGEVWRARISDPSGVFTVYAGNYQPEAAHALSQLQPPQFVAITGKARTYEPEPGSVFVSIRPETVTVVDKATRDQWILDTARRTLERLEAVRAARKEPQASAEALVAKGIPRAIAEGAILAQTHYGLTDTERFAATVKSCLGPLAQGTEMPVVRIEPREPQAGFSGRGAMTQEPAAPAPAWTPPATLAAPKVDTERQAAQDALDDAVLASVQRLEGQKGAKWDEILTAMAGSGKAAEEVEESLNRLMDKGMVYEPTLGVLKTT